MASIGSAFRSSHDDGAIFDTAWSRRVGQHLDGLRARQVVRDHRFEAVEPEIGDRGEHDAFAGNRVGQHDVERRHSIGRENQQPRRRRRDRCRAPFRVR